MSSKSRLEMNKALKKIVVPYIREHGFKGSLPHFRRQNESHIDLITFQYYNGAFAVNLAICSPDGINDEWVTIPPNKVTVYDISGFNRFRLSENMLEITDQWFDFWTAKNDEDYNQLALEVKNLLQISDRNWIKDFYEANKIQ